MHKKKVMSGIITDIDRTCERLSFVLLTTEFSVEYLVPVYAELNWTYIGKFVSITTERTGFLGRHFRQRVETGAQSVEIELPYRAVRHIQSSMPNGMQKGVAEHHLSS